MPALTARRGVFRAALVALLAALAWLGWAAQARAETIYGVTESDQLVTFDSAVPGTITSVRPITGLAAGDAVVGIDVRAADGRLYALGQQDRIYTIAPATGVATQVGSAPFAPAIVGAEPGLDISGAADRIRIVSNIDENLRVNPDTGVAIDGDAIAEGPQPDTPLDTTGTVTAIAYTNSFPGATATTLFGIDTTADNLVMIGGDGGAPSPSGGSVTIVGPLGVNVAARAGLDATANGDRFFASLSVGGVTGLYTVNRSTGQATLLGPIGAGAPLRDIAVLSRPVTIWALKQPNTLMRLRSANPGITVGEPLTVTGLSVGVPLVAIDVRPATGQLYGLDGGARLWTIDTSTGAATAVGASPVAPALAAGVGVDFDAVRDVLRVVDADDRNLRVDPATGVATADTPIIDPALAISAIAYTNPVPGAAATTLFGLDATSDQSFRIGGPDGVPSPDLGVPATAAPMGIDIDAGGGLDAAPVDGSIFMADSGPPGTALFRLGPTATSPAPIGPMGPPFSVFADIAVASPGRLAFSAADAAVSEGAGQATITVSRLGGTDGTLQVDVTAAPAGAGPADFAPFTRTIAFRDGETSVAVPVSIAPDTLKEAEETVVLTLSNPSAGLGAPAAAILRIQDDDTPAIPTAPTTPTTPTAPAVCPGIATAGRNVVRGTSGADRLRGTRGRDVICGLGGRDVIFGLAGNDVITGGPGNDILVGGLGADTLRGQAGADRLTGGAGRDVMDGGAGRDVIVAIDRLRDTVRGGAGIDRAQVDAKDRRQGIERIARLGR